MYSCPETQGQATKPAISGMVHCTGCSKVSWNQGSQKYLRRETLNGKSVQMLIDTGCTKTIVSFKYLDSNSLDHVNTEEILCVHGDKVRYPTAEVKLRLGQWSRTTMVVAAADIPVPVLLGTDIYALASDNPVMVTMRTQARKDSDVTSHAEETTKETAADLVMTNGDTPANDVLDSECGEATTESEVTEQRRDEVPTSTFQELNPLEANADTIRQ